MTSDQVDAVLGLVGFIFLWGLIWLGVGGLVVFLGYVAESVFSRVRRFLGFDR